MKNHSSGTGRSFSLQPRSYNSAMVKFDYLYSISTIYQVRRLSALCLEIKPEKEKVFHVGVLVLSHAYFPDTVTDAIRTFKKRPKRPILLGTKDGQHVY